MPHHDAPPIDASGAADRLVDDMKLFLRGGPVPDESGEEPRDHTRTWDYGAATADPRDWTPSPAGQDTARDRVIGPYRVIRWVASGGMGDVFHARHRDLPLEVALKTIRAKYAGERGVRERFRVEAAAAAKLDHPNVVKLYGFDEHEGELYIAMEWAPGGDLSGRLAGKPLPAREAAALVRTLAAAMAYAHGRGVLHRDLKPRNVLLTTDGTPKVADFGLARLRADDESGGLTNTGAVMGTPAYMAPEQAEGREANACTDVYALGAILYEVLAGEPPFSGDSNESLLKRVLEVDPPRPSSAGGVPTDLEAVCSRCLSKDAADRYQTAGELVADLDRFLSGEPIAPGPWLRLRRVGRAVRRRWRWAAVGGACLVTALAVFVATRPARPPDGESPAVRQAIESELRAGRPFELVGSTGWPKWFRWRAGVPEARRVLLAPDGVAAVDSEGDVAPALLELAPAPLPSHYRLTARVRHDRSRPAGRVGVYVGHHTYQREPIDVQMLITLHFNGVVATPPPVVITAESPEAGKKMVLDAHTNIVELGARFLIDRSVPSHPEGGIADSPGSGRTLARGDRNDHWFQVSIDVTPERVTASLDDIRAALPTETILRRFPDSLARLRSVHPTEQALVDLPPRVDPGGGVGLYVHRGSMSVSDVTLTPIPPR